MICWYCYWGWPKEVMDIYVKGASSIGEHGMLYGPGHVVWADENFETEIIEECISSPYKGTLEESEVKIAIEALTELLKVPESIRCCEPESYDGENPENYPPPSGLEMVKP